MPLKPSYRYYFNRLGDEIKKACKAGFSIELLSGFEPETSSLPRKCSTPELQQQIRTFPSLLSDSNQRPRDYKSRALAS